MGSQICIWSAQNILTDVIVLVYYVYSMYISCEMVGFVIRSTDIVLSFKHNFNLFLKEAEKEAAGGGGGHLGKGGCANVLPDIRDKREPSQSPCRKGGFCMSFPWSRYQQYARRARLQFKDRQQDLGVL